MSCFPRVITIAASSLLLIAFAPQFVLADDEASSPDRERGEIRSEENRPQPEPPRDREGPGQGRPPAPDGLFGPGDPRGRMRPGGAGGVPGDVRQQFMQRMGEILDRLERLERRMDAGPGDPENRPPMAEWRRDGRPEWQGDRRGEGFRPDQRGPREGDRPSGDRPPMREGRPFEERAMPAEMRRRMEGRMPEDGEMMEQARQKMEEARQRLEGMQKRIQELEAEIKRLKEAD